MPQKIIKAPRKPRVVRSDPEILGGSPSFVGTRVHVKTMFDYLEDGLDEFLDHFPTVSREKAIGALRLARDLVLEHAYSS